MEEAIGKRGIVATPLPEPQLDIIMLAVPSGDKEAFNAGLQGVMGGMPAAEPRKKSSNSISRYENGTAEDMKKVFERLSLKDVNEFESNNGWGMRGDLPDGTRVIIRSESSDGPPTLQIIDMNRPEQRTVQEIRFGKRRK